MKKKPTPKRCPVCGRRLEIRMQTIRRMGPRRLYDWSARRATVTVKRRRYVCSTCKVGVQLHRVPK